MTNGITQVGNWTKEVNTLLQDALQTSIDVCGKTGAKACKDAIVFMAYSAGKKTPQAKKNRTIQRDEKKRPYLEAYTKKGKRRWYLPNRKQYPLEYTTFLANMAPIRHRGLAKRSWLWGLKDLPGRQIPRKPITGVAWIRTLLGDKQSGYILTNSLNYILKIMPGGWQSSIMIKAAHHIMGYAKDKLERNWKREMERNRRAGVKAGAILSQYFLKG